MSQDDLPRPDGLETPNRVPMLAVALFALIAVILALTLSLRSSLAESGTKPDETLSGTPVRMATARAEEGLADVEARVQRFEQVLEVVRSKQERLAGALAVQLTQDESAETPTAPHKTAIDISSSEPTSG